MSKEQKIYIVSKSYYGGRIEFVGAYYSKELAQQVASQSLPDITKTFTIGLTEINLFGAPDGSA